MIISDTFTNLIATNDYYKAQDLNTSILEYLQKEVKQHGVGYNQSINCEFKDGKFTETLGDPVYCNDNLKTLFFKDEKLSDPIYDNVELNFEIKGRPGEGEKFINECMDGWITSGCYTIPSPGKGTAGDNCMLYNPELNASDVDNELLHVCNWNKLQFGSSASDRVVIPLYYYSDDSGTPSKWTNIDAPVHFVLRLRTPCDNSNIDNVDEFGNCDDSIRFYLDVGEDGILYTDNNVVAQWQIVGDKNGLLPKENTSDLNKIANDNTAIFEENINKYNNSININTIDILSPQKKIIETNSYIVNDDFNSALKSIDKPVLIIYLSDKLFESNITKKVVPYLEYQLVTPEPTSNPETELNVTVSINGNRFEKSLKISKETNLIDFAIQN